MLKNLIRFVIASEHSSDDTVPYEAARLFSAQPDSFVAQVEKLSAPDRKILYQRLESVWSEVSKALSPDVQKDREIRLSALRPQ